ncbi:MAG: helix-turn-helix domain-containing protein [Clostridia bacterium]|nr:helix-turn-helix domain-containing protein [Clostridia bacterium]
MFLQIVEFNTSTPTFMPTPHSHDYYELYFQLDGNNRQLFIENKMYLLPAKIFCVIPPFCMHKMDGNNHRRININISKDLLSAEEIKFLDNCAKQIAIKFDDGFFDFLTTMLIETAKIYASSDKISKDYEISFVKTILYFLQKQELNSIKPISTTEKEGITDPLILKLIFFINENYQSHINLKMLCDKFFLSKATLCARFKNLMKCSIMDYLLRLRLSKARELLLSGDSSIEEISFVCGFSSVNFFRIKFKQIMGVTPLHYRKDIRG